MENGNKCQGCDQDCANCEKCKKKEKHKSEGCDNRGGACKNMRETGVCNCGD